MATETITAYIRDTTLGTSLGFTNGFANHMYLLYTNSRGEQRYIGGWSSNEGSLLNEYGTLDAQEEAWGSRAWDWQYRNLVVASQQIAVGSNLSSFWQSMEQCVAAIDSKNIPYGFLGFNSNAVINTCLRWAGLPEVTIDSSDPFSSLWWTPGGHINLNDPLHGVPGGLGGPPASSGERTRTGWLDFYDETFGFGSNGLFGNVGGADWGGYSPGYWRYVEVWANPGTGWVKDGGWHFVSTVVRDTWATRIKPVILDMDGDGLELTGFEASPGFDVYGDGYEKPSGWFKGGDAMLVFDANRNGRVDNISEISFLHHSPGATSDLQALAVFDSNRNGQLDAGDGQFATFRLWRDSNFNGRSDSGELTTLSALGVQSLSLSRSGGGYELAGNDVLGTTTYTRTNGTRGNAFDVGLEALLVGAKGGSSNDLWAVIQVEGDGLVAVLQPAYQTRAITINSLLTYEANGVNPMGFQTGDGHDTLKLDQWGAYEGYFISSMGGDDTINLQGSPFVNRIVAGPGSDYITSGNANDFISPGAGYYNLVVDSAGNDTFTIERSNYNSIYDRGGGADIALIAGYTLSSVDFFTRGSDVVFAARDGTLEVSFKEMLASASEGIEYLMFEDQVLVRTQIIERARAGGDRSYDRPFDPAHPLISQAELEELFAADIDHKPAAAVSSLDHPVWALSVGSTLELEASGMALI